MRGPPRRWRLRSPSDRRGARGGGGHGLSSRRSTGTARRPAIAATVRDTIRDLLESTQETIDALLALPEDELVLASSHVCAQGKDLWALLTNDIDHEDIHAGQVFEGRYEARITASPMQRLMAEWLEARAKFVGSLIGLTDEQFNTETAPGGWTYRVVAKHLLDLERHSLKTIAGDIAARQSA